MILESLENYLNRPTKRDFYALFRQISTLMRSGVELNKATADIAEYTENKQLAAALKNISRKMQAGISAGAAFQNESIFPKIVAPTIEAGERSQQQVQTFDRLSKLMLMEYELSKKVNSALLTPKLSAVIMFIMTIAYIKLAIPQYVKLYEESGIELPWIVAVVTAIVNGIVDYWYITLLVIYGIYRAFNWFVENRTDTVDSIRLRLPIYKKLHFNFVQHQFVTILGLMLSSGLETPVALAQAAKAVDNSIIANAILKVRNSILKGIVLSDSLKRNNSDNTFDYFMISNVYAGERNDDVSSSLEECSKYYEREINYCTDTVSTKLTLLVMLPMGALIVVMFLFTLIPTFSYINQITM